MISVVIPIYNQHDFATECIYSVLENTKDFELVLVDNGSEPPFKPPFSGFVETTLIRNETNLGFPCAINMGIQKAKGDVVIILNDDVIVTPSWADKLTRWIDDLMDGYAIVGPVTNYAAGLQRVIIGTYGNKNELYKEADAWANDYDGELQEVNFVIGFCMAFKKTLFEEIGDFDESLWPCSGEEIDFCFRVREAGYSIGIAHDCYVHHEGSQTFGDMERAGQVVYDDICKRNDAHLEKKWGAGFWMKQAVEQEEGGEENGQ